MMTDRGEQFFEERLGRLRRSLYRLRNGETVSLMEKEGILYDKNYGLRFSEILSVADEFLKDHAFAVFLRTFDVREYRMISMLLDDWEAYDTVEIVRLCSDFRYQEQAEFAARYAFPGSASGMELCQQLMVAAEKYARMTGNLLLARLSIEAAGGLPEGAKYISLLRGQLAGLESFDRSIAVSASALAKWNDAFRLEILKLVEELKNRTERHLLLVAYEIEIRL